MSLVTEKGICYERKVPVSLDTMKVLKLILFKAQVALGVLVEGFGWPTVEISSQNALRFPIFAVCGLEIRRFRELNVVFIGSDHSHFLALQVFHGQHLGESPEKMISNLVGTIGFSGNGADVIL